MSVVNPSWRAFRMMLRCHRREINLRCARFGLNGATMRRNGNHLFGPDNDGAGSGMDADLLDGYHASAFALLSAFASGSNANGYWYKIPTASGPPVIRQRGRRASGWSAYTGEHQETVYFPVPYQWGESVFVTFGQQGNDSSSDGYVQLKAVYADRFVVQHQHPSSVNMNYGWDWMAEGQ